MTVLRVVSAAILCLVRELEIACETSFDAIMKTSWQSITTVTGPSSYIHGLTKSVESVVSTVQASIEQKKYFRNFLDKAAG